MAGRPPKPSALKLVEGNRGKRATTKQEPDPDYLFDLTAPQWLPARAKLVWEEVAPQLSRAKLLTEVDVQALAMGCVAIAQYRAAVAKTGEDLIKSKVELNDEGKEVVVGEHINPWALIQSMTFKQAMVIFQQFGMSPAARTRIAVNPQGSLFPNDNSQSKAGKYFQT
ncbi:phage terminase small subunit P27 family [Limnobacter alexandrii]|uniref:phage terminase small subunit P27 family n=1 Tax=Limnobacter alexandrii TaxID=2570352 RepID=UPI001109B8A0|nr:phage terminase small subunit P27 family [Limnobacter alexandrii]